MTANRAIDDRRLLSLASSISEGTPVNWDPAPDDDPETTAIIDELRVIDGLSRLSDPVPRTWGAFEIRGEIGRGSYGTVYRAFDPQLDLEIALKVIRPRGLDVSFDAARALNEARLLAQINHPNVVRVYSAERVNQDVGVSMELVRGQTLSDLVRAQGPFSAGETMLIGVDVCRALAAVHAARLLHGDIKATNVMRAEGGRTVLMDFGAGDDLKTMPLGRRSNVGTPVYLAPEVFAGAKRTRVSDIYSFGVLLYYLATAAYPVGGTTETGIVAQHATRAPRRLLRDVRPDLPDAFIHVIDRATAERPQDRYQSAGELEAALQQAIQGVAPGPTPPRYRWAALLAAASVAIALGIGAWLSNTWTTTSAPSSQLAAGTTAGAPLAPAVPTATVYRIEASFYREQDGRGVRLPTGARVSPGDRLWLQVVSSIPTYIYVVNEDDRGESFLLYPLPGQQPANPLPAGKRHEIPGVVNDERTFWQVTSAGGREHFVIFASPEPPTPAFARMFAALARPAIDAPVLAHPLSREMVGALRGVGGLSVAPARPAGAQLANEFAVPLPDGEETAHGVWVRQLTLDNPGK
jgi:serine/threonine protein kinase